VKERFCRIVRIVVGVKNDSRVPKRAARRDEGRRRVCWRRKASKPREKAGIVRAVIWVYDIALCTEHTPASQCGSMWAWMPSRYLGKKSN